MQFGDYRFVFTKDVGELRQTVAELEVTVWADSPYPTTGGIESGYKAIREFEELDADLAIAVSPTGQAGCYIVGVPLTERSLEMLSRWQHWMKDPQFDIKPGDYYGLLGGTHPDHRGRGLMSALMDAFYSNKTDRRVWGRTSSSNKPIVHKLDALGFKLIGEFKQGTDQTRVIYRRD